MLCVNLTRTRSKTISSITMNSTSHLLALFRYLLSFLKLFLISIHHSKVIMRRGKLHNGQDRHHEYQTASVSCFGPSYFVLHEWFCSRSRYDGEWVCLIQQTIAKVMGCILVRYFVINVLLKNVSITVKLPTSLLLRLCRVRHEYG